MPVASFPNDYHGWQAKYFVMNCVLLVWTCNSSVCLHFSAFQSILGIHVKLQCLQFLYKKCYKTFCLNLGTILESCLLQLHLNGEAYQDLRCYPWTNKMWSFNAIKLYPLQSKLYGCDSKCFNIDLLLAISDFSIPNNWHCCFLPKSCIVHTVLINHSNVWKFAFWLELKIQSFSC